MEALEKINHPKHYNNHPSGVEIITIIRSCSFNIGNAIKYLFRRNDKDNILENMKKALWYIDDEIKRRSRYNYFLRLPNLFKYNEYIERSKLVEKIINNENNFVIGEIYSYLNEADYNYRSRLNLLFVRKYIMDEIEKEILKQQINE